MSYKRFFLIRIPLTLILAAFTYITTVAITDTVLYSILALLTTTIIGLILTTFQFTRIKENPETMNNGGVEVKEVPNVTDEEIFEIMRRTAKGETVRHEPEIIPPPRQIAVTQAKDFNQAARDVVLAKFVAALERSEFKVNVKGMIDNKGEMNFKKLEFGIKTGPQTTEKTVQEPEKKSPQVLKRPQVG